MLSKIGAETEQWPSLIMSLHDDVIINILARVPRFDYPTLSLVSKHFRSLVTSRDLYARRSLLGCTEPCIYAILFDQDTRDHGLYILRNRKRLVLIQLLPRIPSCASIVSVGSKIYVLGGIDDDPENMPSTGLSIDCRSHTVRSIPSMPMPMKGVTVVDIIDRKIYVIGYCTEDWKKKVIMVFNAETETWEPEMTKLDMELSYVWHGNVVMGDDKVYIKDSHNSFLYKPKESKWEIDKMLNSFDWEFACAVDDILYFFQHWENKLRAYDTKRRSWELVQGVEEFLPQETSKWISETVNYGGKLAVFLPKEEEEEESSSIKEIWCTVIAIAKHYGGREIWGKVEWCGLVLKGDFLLHKCFVVVV